MNVLHVTDLHIPPSGKTFFGNDLHRRFELLVSELNQLEADCLIVTGDFSDSESIQDYDFIADRLGSIKHPVYLCAGNHDCNHAFDETLSRVFPCAKEDEYLRIEREYVLDTRKGRVAAELTAALSEDLKRDDADGRIAYLFMHHPPVRMGSRYLDECCALENVATIEEYLLRVRGVSAVFCGHFHCPLELRHGTIGVHLTPAFCCQFDQSAPTVTVADKRGGYRILSLEDRKYRVETRYLD